MGLDYKWHMQFGFKKGFVKTDSSLPPPPPFLACLSTSCCREASEADCTLSLSCVAFCSLDDSLPSSVARRLLWDSLEMSGACFDLAGTVTLWLSTPTLSRCLQKRKLCLGNGYPRPEGINVSKYDMDGERVSNIAGLCLTANLTTWLVR